METKRKSNFSTHSVTCEPNSVVKNNGEKHYFSNPKKYNNSKGNRRNVKGKNNEYPLQNKFKGTASAFNPKYRKSHKGALALALEEYNTKKVEEQKRREEKKKKKEEMNRALQRYKEKKAQKLKRLCKKTKKGQPIMKYWIEDLLQKIQST